MSVDFKHVVFNNSYTSMFGGSPLERLCKEWETEGWMLSHVIPHTQYESVAVFVRGIEVREERTCSCKDGCKSWQCDK